jgi:hypothetical protein
LIHEYDGININNIVFKYYLIFEIIEKKGNYLIAKGDKLSQKKKFKEAAKYYAEALQYCQQKAQKLLDDICNELDRQSTNSSLNSSQSTYQQPCLESSSIQPSVLSITTQVSELAVKSAPDLRTKLLGPYFPTETLLNIPAPQSDHSTLLVQSQSEDINNVTTTLHLKRLFIMADEKYKSTIRSWIYDVIHQFNSKPVTLWSIQEIIILTETKDKDIFIRILDQLLRIERDSLLQSDLIVHGLAVVLYSATEEIDLNQKYGLFVVILESLKKRLHNVWDKNNNKELLSLLRALSSLFKAMLCRGIKGLDRENVFNPLKSQLDKLSKSDNPEVSFLAKYASQSLVYIGNDESLGMSIFRRGKLAIGVTMDIKEIVISFDISKFEDAYNKIMDMSDTSIKLGWYQALMFIDSLLAEQKFKSIELFILHSRYNPNITFMQGVCFRLEQVAMIYRDQEIGIGAMKLLQDIKSCYASDVSKIAEISLKRILSCSKG